MRVHACVVNACQSSGSQCICSQCICCQCVPIVCYSVAAQFVARITRVPFIFCRVACWQAQRRNYRAEIIPFKFASLHVDSFVPNAKRVAPSVGTAAVGPRIACRRTWHHERAPNFSGFALQFARCALLSWLEAHPTRMRADEPIAISALNGFGLGSTNLYSKVRRKLRSCSLLVFVSCFNSVFVSRCNVTASATRGLSDLMTCCVFDPKKSKARAKAKVRAVAKSGAKS